MKWVNILRYFYLLGAANALFFSLLIFSKPKRNTADKLLGFWLIALTLQLLFPFFYLSDLESYYPYAGLEITFYAVHPLLLYLYVRRMTGKFPSGKEMFFLVLSAMIVESTVLAYFMIPAEKRFGLITGNEPLEFIYYLFGVPIIGYFIFFFMLTVIRLRNYKSNILHIYSYKENIDLLWLRRLVLFFYGLLSLSFPMGLLFYIYDIPIAEGDYFYFAGLTFFIFFLGYWGYKQGNVFNYNVVIDTSKQTKKIENNKPDVQKILKGKALELKKIMEENKPYLDPALTIYELARLMNMQPYQLSKLINSEFNCNFFEYINHYRIESFKEYLFSDNYKDFTLLAIALECGFNSKSAFNRVFKEQTGITPGEFKKQHFQQVVKEI